MIRLLIFPLLLVTPHIYSSAQELKNTVQCDVRTIELGLENNDDRCVLNALFHALSGEISSHKNELEKLSEESQNSVVHAYLQDLSAYQRCTRFTYALDALYDWWVTKNYERLPYVLFPTFVEEWNQVVNAGKPSLLYACLMPAAGYEHDALNGQWNIVGNSCLEDDLNGIVLAENAPDIVILDAQFQEGVVRSVLESTYIVDKRDQKEPYKVPEVIDLTQHFVQGPDSEPNIYELISVICNVQAPVNVYKGQGHATSYVKTMHGYWVYMNDVLTRKVELSEVLRCELPKSVNLSEEFGCESTLIADQPVYEIGQLFIYKRKSLKI